MLHATHRLKATLGMAVDRPDAALQVVLPVQPPPSLWEIFDQIPAASDPDWCAWEYDATTAWFPTSKDDFDYTWGLSAHRLIERVRGAFRGEQPPVQISISAMESFVNSQIDAYVHHGAVVARCTVFIHRPLFLLENMQKRWGEMAAARLKLSLIGVVPDWDPDSEDWDAVVVDETRRIEGTDLVDVLQRTEAFYEQHFWHWENKIKALHDHAEERR